jgi:hypothetical protein
VLFLIEYDRAKGKLISFTPFEDGRAADASQARLHREVELARSGNSLEVVVLEAASEEDLQRTHRRYFETVTELTKSK